MKAKFKLTDEYKINAFGVKLFRIEATVDIEARGIKKGEKGGFVEKEENLSGNAWVYDDAQVSGDARVYGNAGVYGDKHYTKGWFIGGDDTGKITNVTDQMGTDYWKAQYVLGDYEITNKTPEKKDNPKEIQIDGATYVLREDK